MKFFRLKGWQRLWVVASLVWLVCVFFLSIDDVLSIRQLALIWLVPSIGVYLLGLGVGWVWRGFKSEGK